MEQNQLNQNVHIITVQENLQTIIPINEANLDPYNQLQMTDEQSQENLNNQDHYSYEFIQPETHKLAKTMTEYFTTVCCGGSYDLSRDEIKIFNELKFKANITVDAQDENHIKMVQSLWYILKEQEMKETKNEEWKFFGFQNANPFSDFRGGGLLSLKHLIFYAQSNTKRIYDDFCNQKNDFLFAITSINVSYFLKIYFHLAQFLTYEKNKSDICGRRALQSFCHMLKEDDNITNLLHNLLLDDIYLDWIQLKSRVQTTTLMDFNPIIQDLQIKFQKCFQQQYYSNFQEFERIYRRFAKRQRK